MLNWRFPSTANSTYIPTSHKVSYRSLLLPIALPLAFDVVTGGFEMLLDIAAVVVVADFEEHFDADSAKWGEPHRAAMENLNDVGAGFGDLVEERGEHAGAVENEELEHDVAALAHQHLFEYAGKQIGVDIAAAE